MLIIYTRYRSLIFSDRWESNVNKFALRHGPRHKIVYNVIWAQVPGGPHKKDLLENLDRVPTYVQQLQFTVKNPTVGKAATFTKVDNVIQETKNLMNVISKVVTTCFVCATKVSHGNIQSIRLLTRHVIIFFICVTEVACIK